RQMGNQLKDGPCRVIVAPFDVRLPLRDEREEDIINVVQPDISVVCDPRKLDKKGCLGAPDLVIEILSPGTSRMDRFYKFNLYQRAGVKEYWLVSPDDNIVEVYRFEVGGNYAKRESYCETDTVQVTFSNGNTITIDLASVFRVKADTEAG
ncbi:MAG: Uma2 family endonuclease, partial [bacterium]|nr:Uma2 family endonuclease [bacterium]